MTFTPASLRWLETILEERYGLRLTLREEGQELTLALPGAEGRIRFDTLKPEFHQSRSDFPCGRWDAAGEGFTPALGEPLPTPAMAELPARMVEQAGQGDVVIHYDILGLTYWMLTRLEEVGRTDLDDHGRFPATSSHAYEHEYLERPIVDEWLNLLAQVIKIQWPGVELKKHQFSIKVSHDVDWPSRYGFKTWTSLLKTMGGDLLKRRQLQGLWVGPRVKLNSGEKLHPLDPANTFEWIMDESEKSGLTSAFYFISGRTDPGKDSDYELEHPAIRSLLHRINERGHEIGLHPSYGTYQAPQLIGQEFSRLKSVCEKEGISQSEWGGRMHFLRWEQPTTLQAWNDAGLNYDSTLSYADRPGFRCGTCFEYFAFNPLCQSALNVRVRPLVAMECTVIARRYLGLGASEEALNKFMELKEGCRKVGGCFSLLWHNTEFETQWKMDIYKRLIHL
ncbi:polysaccharide deacetylase family protein [Halomonas sp. SL1]|uniref:polysaccharide deacetylase family protein n=1 Tax=Halomonas sp. SL1 TaxID=2137478 RepID=UPI000D160C29|nr:polysaccharide deacetylase family protein [Halomonas sp. SL1]RAH38223.1 hypothetical protein C9J49_007315 [Halomonas sp. SL1]